MRIFLLRWPPVVLKFSKWTLVNMGLDITLSDIYGKLSEMESDKAESRAASILAGLGLRRSWWRTAGALGRNQDQPRYWPHGIRPCQTPFLKASHKSSKDAARLDEQREGLDITLSDIYGKLSEMESDKAE
jgi:hypothetical protein